MLDYDKEGNLRHFFAEVQQKNKKENFKHNGKKEEQSFANFVLKNSIYQCTVDSFCRFTVDSRQ